LDLGQDPAMEDYLLRKILKRTEAAVPRGGVARDDQ